MQHIPIRRLGSLPLKMLTDFLFEIPDPVERAWDMGFRALKDVRLKAAQEKQGPINTCP